MVGRPTKLTDALLRKAEDYIENYESCGDAVPTVVGLALEIGVSRSTCYEWADRDDRFSDIFTRVESTQERRLVTGGLEGDYNPAITKMMLTKHGYTDKVEQAHISPDGSMSPRKEPKEMTLDELREEARRRGLPESVFMEALGDSPKPE